MHSRTETVRTSWLPLLQCTQRGLDSWNVGRKLLAGTMRGVARLIARLKQLMQFVQRRVRKSAPAQLFFDDGLRNCRGGNIQPFTQLFLQQPKNGGKKFLGLLPRGECRKFAQSLVDPVRDFTLPPQ